MSDERKRRFLLGRGEHLTSRVPWPARQPGKPFRYSWNEQRRWLSERMIMMQEAASGLSDAAKPLGQYVAKVTLHPQHISRSAFPEHLVRQFDLRLLGSRPDIVRPRAGRGADREEGVRTTSLFLAGRSENFDHLIGFLSDGEPDLDDPRHDEALIVEDFGLYTREERILHELSSRVSPLELILHFNPAYDREWQEQFIEFASQCDVEMHQNLESMGKGLWYVPAHASADAVQQLSEFAFIRAIHSQPKLRPLQPPQITRARSTGANVELPEALESSAACRVAIFDGGLLPIKGFEPWVRSFAFAPKFGIGQPVKEYQEHGTAVTSAVLFGHVDSDVPNPACHVDHYRVLGDQVRGDDLELPRVQHAIKTVLQSTNYDFIVLCLGPEKVIDDGEVSSFGAMLDSFLKDGTKLLTLAIGNNGGEQDPKNQRVQVPSDAVNAMAVGAADSIGNNWQKATYSAVGPGRHPGKVKPDVVHFGGDTGNEFKFAFPDGKLWIDAGTSYATPAVMRLSTLIRSEFGPDILPLGLKALIINTACQNGIDKLEVGWGRTANHVAEVMECGDGEVRIIYQDTISPGQVKRHPIPLPDRELLGKVNIKATFCFACATDPTVPGDYTGAAFDVTFRPHVDRFRKGDTKKVNPESKSFFRSHDWHDEHELRASAGKWETVLNDEHGFYATSLKRPVFDVHYVARKSGYASSPSDAVDIRYALVVTVSCKKDANLYEDVLSEYDQILEVFGPVVETPVEIEVG